MAVLIKERRLTFAASLLEREYYFEPRSGEPKFRPFILFRPFIRSIEEDRNRRLESQSVSITADLLKERAASGNVSFAELMETDFVLCLRSLLKVPGTAYWFPMTLAYASEFEAFRLFRLAESKKYFAELKVLLGVGSKEELIAEYQRSAAHQNWSDEIRFNRGFHHLSIPELGNFEKLDTRP